MKVSDTSYDALKEGIEKDLKRLANDITLQNEAKKMYESILAATGDVNFAAQITTSTTGLDTLDVFSKLREQLKKTLTAYQTKSGGLIDWDTLFATDEAGSTRPCSTSRRCRPRSRSSQRPCRLRRSRP